MFCSFWDKHNMLSLLILGFVVSFAEQQVQTSPSRCDELRVVRASTPCTSCAATPATMCPRGFRKTTRDYGNADCSYTVNIGGRPVVLPGCRHTCEKVVTEPRCCPNFWGPLCLSCPTWSARVCNGHGHCIDGDAGNGTCVCNEGFSGFACHQCQDINAYGERCDSECRCVNGECNRGPSGNGECYCHPPYTGPKCDTVATSCVNCTAYSYCKEQGSSSVCECLPGFRKVGSICTGTCGTNADCTYLRGGKFQCKCKAGYAGDGQLCLPINPCSEDNGGCPTNSTICVYAGPGKSRCVCKSGMGDLTPSQACSPTSACTESACDASARCETGPDGLPSCLCGAHQISDGRRCYGNIMERILELDRSGRQKGKLTGSITLFEKGCQLTLSKHGPFTAFVPLLKSEGTENLLCKQHLILGQHLFRDLQENDFWTFGGEPVRFKEDKRFGLIQDPHTLYSIIQSDIPASNGIIHIIDMPIRNANSSIRSDQKQFGNETIGEIISQDPKFSRFRSLLDNCDVLMPLRSAGPLTVFVPINSAIDLFRDGSVMHMITHAQHKLRELLRNHMFSKAAVALDQLASMPQTETMADQILRVNVTSDGRMFLGGKAVILENSNIVASNGIIHMIDGMLVPPSILPILPKRCDIVESRITLGPCVPCDLLSLTNCPPGSTEHESHMMGCEYQASHSSSTLPGVKGCAKYCNSTRTTAECCKGFYGPDCRPCLGGFQNPCYGKGTCLEGILGNGTCSCAPGFKGIGCHICSDQNKHGEMCDEDCRCVHGMCDNRPGSLGVCRRGSCHEGYSGELCDKTAKPCNSDGVFQICHAHANCDYSGLHPMCVCSSGYEGDGLSCTPVNLCLATDRGGCDINAQCVYSGPANVSCVCDKGWTGDGLACVEINNCLLDNQGGCHENATCIFRGPGEHECICKTGYMGNGLVCDIINPCLTDNGGCHSLASCELQMDGSHLCVCPNGYGGDGAVCYGSMLAELDANSDFYPFYSLMKKSSLLDLKENITALVPSKDAFNNLTDSEKDFWTEPHRLPYLLKVHFLDHTFTYKDLTKQVHKEIATLDPQTKWEIKNKSGEIMIDNASILISDIPVVKGYIHVIDKVLKPRLSDVPQVPPGLLELLNNTPSYSLFRQAALLYNLTDIIQLSKYTVFVPVDDAIKEYLGRKKSTRLDEDSFRYHIIPSEQLFPDNIRNGLVKSTLLGSSYQIMFHANVQNQTLANEILLDGIFNETEHGAVFGVSRVLEIHKNRCDKDLLVIKTRGKCGPCDGTPICPNYSKPVQTEFPPSMKPNCEYRKRKTRRLLPGCFTFCLEETRDYSCCPGYFGHSCFKCPGKVGKWCSSSGRCEDGVFGSGECLCNEGFHGTACETCEPGRYGTDCKSVCNCNHGKCVDGIDGDGRCLCYKGWKGANCSVETVADACGGVCDENANCLTEEPRAPPSCSCVAGFQGNGTFCKEVDPCKDDNGGCSQHANCTRTVAGERSCTCAEGYVGDGVVCLEIDRCLENNGGCHKKADCFKTGPNEVACICTAGYSGNGLQCQPINPCKKNNGGCSLNAKCKYIGPGARTCTCRDNFIGDGVICQGSLSYEIKRHPAASWLNKQLRASKVGDLKGKGPFTVFIPHWDYVRNVSVEPWVNRSRVGDLLRYHMIGCKQMLQSDLQLMSEMVTLSGHSLRLTVREGTLYINGESKIVSSDYVTSTGVIHFIDNLLVPYDLNNRTKGHQEMMNITAAADAYGYTIISRLLQDAGLMDMLQNPLHHPLMMLWPSDDVFHTMPEERKRWLYSEEHHDKLVSYMKAHVIRGTKRVAASLTDRGSLRTMYGSSLSFSCDKIKVGDVLADDGNARITERHLLFDVGIAYGIDQLLEPPSLGARCDKFVEDEVHLQCKRCGRIPVCPTGFRYTGKSIGCKTKYDTCGVVCEKLQWVPQCCKNHYGRDCQVCPGGLEAPCSNHGTCNDSMVGHGNCVCHPGFMGTACERCEPNHYGANCTECSCTSDGKCEDGIEGDGTCFCKEGWTGAQCEVKLADKPVCTPPCHPSAVCQSGNVCECEPLYEGDGRNCTAPDLCADDNGGCHERASCVQSGADVTCLCVLGYTGDGFSCSPINRCVEEDNGGCSDFATCLFTGPNERRCQCLAGYVGDGTQCLKKVEPPADRCLDNNGGCDPRAHCKDLHFHENTGGVFHVRSPAGKYKLIYSEAQAACHAEQASLATFSQLSHAQQLGMHLCVAGWMEEKQVGYPVTFPSVRCGNNRVGIVLYKDPTDLNSTYDAYCYRMKDVSCECDKDYVGNGLFCNGNLASIVATDDNLSVFYSILLNYTNSCMEGDNLMDLLSSQSSYVTLFIPQNSGFNTNQTLSWRDVKYHVSANNSVHFYDDLQHGTVIPSQLGYNLSVVTSLPNGRLNLSSNLGKKWVNQRLIVHWDIPAVNGIIHVIEGPLIAPLLSPAVGTGNPDHQSQPDMIAVVSVLCVALAVAIVGLALYFLKNKNDAFQFHYFKNDEDDGENSSEAKPTLVSIPNPLYSGFRVFAEPFGDSHEDDSAGIHHLYD